MQNLIERNRRNAYLKQDWVDIGTARHSSTHGDLIIVKFGWYLHIFRVDTFFYLGKSAVFRKCVTEHQIFNIN